ncbi:MAG: hypothetical protein IKW36_00540 [Alistipes sp.]|nr:hypothetical protein [Alistipes sp.]
MKRFKFIYLLLAVVGVVSMASCQHKYADWAPGAKETNMGVYFPSTTSSYAVTTEDSVITIDVARINTAEAAQVSFRAEAKDANNETSDLFSFPQYVSFEAGVAESTLAITFNGAELVEGQAYTVTIKLDEKEATQYGVSEFSFTVMLPEPWVSMGVGIYFDDLLCGMLEEADAFRGTGAYVEYEQNAKNPNRIRVKNVYAPETIGAMWGAVPSWMTFTATGDTYVEFDITDPNHVIAGQVFEMEDEAGNVATAYGFPLYISVVGDSAGNVYDLYGFTWSESPIVLADGIITFPTNGDVELAAFKGGQYAGYFAKANPSGYLQFFLPGTEFVNYDMQATYDGMYVSADGATAKAIFNFALGADVATYKFAFVPGDVTADPSAVAEAIVAGSEELVIFESPASTKRWEVELTKGLYTLVAVPYTAEGEARLQNTYALDFYFNGTGEMPEVELGVSVGVPSSFAAEENKAAIEEETPAPYWIGINVVGDPAQLKSMRGWWGTTASYSSAISQGLTDAAIIDGYSADLSSFFAAMAETGSATVRVNVNNYASNYTVLFRAETIYGTVIEEKFEYTMPEYDGAFAIGEYAFTDATSESQSAFMLVPGKSYNDFYFVHNYIDGSMWYAKYDEAAGTLTNEGVELGYEKYNSQWGMIYGAFNEDVTQVYSYFSSTTADFAAMAPMVMTVADNAIAGLETYFAMMVIEYDPVNEAVGGILGAYFNFTPATEIAAVSGGALQARAQSVNRSFKAMTASLECGEAHSAISSVAPERVIKATPVANVGFTMATLKR